MFFAGVPPAEIPVLHGEHAEGAWGALLTANGQVAAQRLADWKHKYLMNLTPEQRNHPNAASVMRRSGAMLVRELDDERRRIVSMRDRVLGAMARNDGEEGYVFYGDDGGDDGGGDDDKRSEEM